MADRSGTAKLGMAQWSALVPMALSLAALASFVGYLVIVGAVREPDEGTGAHVWQLLMVAQLPLAAFFAVTWLPVAPRAAGAVFALQAVAIFANLFVVHSLNL